MTANYDRAVHEHRFDLAVRDGMLVGLVETADEQNQLLIVNVAVAPRVKASAGCCWPMPRDIARDLGKMRVRLYTNQKFTSNIQLYQSLGFAVDREESFGPGIVVHMSKAQNAKLS